MIFVHPLEHSSISKATTSSSYPVKSSSLLTIGSSKQFPLQFSGISPISAIYWALQSYPSSVCPTITFGQYFFLFKDTYFFLETPFIIPGQTNQPSSPFSLELRTPTIRHKLILKKPYLYKSSLNY